MSFMSAVLYKESVSYDTHAKTCNYGRHLSRAGVNTDTLEVLCRSVHYIFNEGATALLPFYYYFYDSI